MDNMDKYRDFLKNHQWPAWRQIPRDEKQGVPAPPLQKPFLDEGALIDLVPPEQFSIGVLPLLDVINRRRSRREFSDRPFTQEELSFLLWTTQGVRHIRDDGVASFRTVPSAGARHPFETYLVIKQVSGLEPGLYRYLALQHKLGFLASLVELGERTDDHFWLEPNEAILFVWTVIPYRTEWRYSILSHKMIAIDAGHVCQNLYLASEAIGAGTCAIGAYWQDEMDTLLGVDGVEEFAIYVARVGKIR